MPLVDSGQRRWSSSIQRSSLEAKSARLVGEGLLHPECERIFRVGKTADGAPGKSILLHKHQEDAIRIAADCWGYSGKLSSL
jgi:hypothetical protein